MLPGQMLAIRLVNAEGSQARIANVLPVVRFFSSQSVAEPLYSFDAWATLPDGSSDNSYRDFEREFEIIAPSSLMEFTVPLNACDATVNIEIPSGAELAKRRARVIDAGYRWQPGWLINWPANGRLAPVAPVRVRLEGRVTRVNIPVTLLPEPPGGWPAAQGGLGESGNSELYRDHQGNIYARPRGSPGRGVPTGFNINDLPLGPD